MIYLISNNTATQQFFRKLQIKSRPSFQPLVVCESRHNYFFLIAPFYLFDGFLRLASAHAHVKDKCERKEMFSEKPLKFL